MSRASREATNGLGRALRLLAAGVLALLTVALGLCVLAQAAAWLDGGSVGFAGQELAVQRGSGNVTSNGLLVQAPAARDNVLVLTPPVARAAARAGGVAWSTLGLREQDPLQVVWTTDRAPGRALAYRPSASERARGRADLTGKPGWEGRIGRVGLLLRGPLPEPVLISSIALASSDSACSTALANWVDAWRHREPWSQRSINFHIGYEPDSTPLTPVLAVAIWVLLALAFDALLCRRCTGAARLSGAAALLLIGWLALDLRWQAQLWERLADSHQRYAGLTQPQRRLAAPDAELTERVNRLLAHLPDVPARVLILSDDPSGFIAGRTRYLLSPHRAYAGLSRLPTASQLAAGDYLFVIGSLRSVHFDRGGGLLTDDGRALPVDPVASIQGLGDLYRVPGGT